MKQINRLVIKLFTPGNLSHTTEMVPCPRGTHLEEGPALDAQLKQFCEEYAKGYPGHEFAVRDLGSGRFNIVWTGATWVN